MTEPTDRMQYIKDKMDGKIILPKADIKEELWSEKDGKKFLLITLILSIFSVLYVILVYASGQDGLLYLSLFFLAIIAISGNLNLRRIKNLIFDQKIKIQLRFYFIIRISWPIDKRKMTS